MRSVRLVLVALLLALPPVLLTGCGSDPTAQSISTQTKGQELLDLQKAKDSGLITEKEYEKQKAIILKRE